MKRLEERAFVDAKARFSNMIKITKFWLAVAKLASKFRPYLLEKQESGGELWVLRLVFLK